MHGGRVNGGKGAAKSVLRAQIGIIGGSGLYNMPGLGRVKEVRVATPFGKPSDAYVVGTIGASLQTIIGGNITLFTELCEKTRDDAYELMLQHAAELGANAVVGARYDATEVMQGVTEVLAYGTAVFVEPAK